MISSTENEAPDYVLPYRKGSYPHFGICAYTSSTDLADGYGSDVVQSKGPERPKLEMSAMSTDNWGWVVLVVRRSYDETTLKTRRKGFTARTRAMHLGRTEVREAGLWSIVRKRINWLMMAMS